MNITHDTEFVLGARDPEMDFIERLLRNNGYKVAFACGQNGDRVHYGAAYPSRTAEGPSNKPYVWQVWIECAPAHGGKLTLASMDIPFIDHHYPGDPGYECGPADYWKGSSVGQLHIMLGLEGTHEAHVIAAIDHCINAAYRGECVLKSTGEVIAPDEILNRQLMGMCLHTGRPIELLKETLETWRKRLRDNTPTPHRTRAGIQHVHEFVHRTITEFWEYLCAREAALIERVCAVVITKFHEPECDPELKLNIVGHPSADFIERFLAGSELYPTVINRYGSPARGYGGGYVTAKKLDGRLNTGKGKWHNVRIIDELGSDHVVLMLECHGIVKIHLPRNHFGQEGEWMYQITS